MTSRSLFSHSIPHGTVNNSTGTAFRPGISFEVTQGGCWLEGYWFYAGGATATQTFTLWCVSGGTSGGTGSTTAIAVPNSTVTSAATPLVANSWNYVPLPTPIPLAIGTTYIAETGYTIVAPFANTSNVFNSGGTYPNGITNGPLFAYNDSAGGGPVADNNPWGGWSQALFAVNAGTDPTVGPPTIGSNAGSFGMDVQVNDTDPTGNYTGPYRLWPNNLAANASTVLDLPEQYVIGCVVVLSGPCSPVDTWFFSPTGATGLPTKADIWRVSDKSNVATMVPAWSGAAGSGWVYAQWSGVTLPADTYVASVYFGNATGSGNGSSGKDSVTNYWVSGRGANGITWGPLSAPKLSASPAVFTQYPGGGTGTGQNVFENLALGPNQFPDKYATSSAQVYWVDLSVNPSPSASGTGTASIAFSADTINSGKVSSANKVMGWDLYSTIALQSEYKRYYDSQPPIACPHDGVLLKQGPSSDGNVLYCPMGNFTYPDDWDPETMSGM